jgi:branched-chain amino acid transport system ATP-binding protein
MTQLVLDQVRLQFGGVAALGGVSLTVQPGEIAAIIGPNGAGKTSLLNTISGLYQPHAGRVEFSGTSLVGRRPHDIARLGVARTFQNLGLFGGLTVMDNLLLGRHVHMRSGLFAAGLFWKLAEHEEAAHRLVIEKIVDLLKIGDVRDRVVGTLAYGLQKRVELGRALAQAPRLLLLDEPMAGMRREEKDAMVRFILDAHAQGGLTLLMIEHDMHVVMDISHRIHVLDFGKRIAHGTPDEVRRDPTVIRAYLGQELAA